MRVKTPISRPGDSGFTLIEILIVLLLLGAAAVLVMPSFTTGLAGVELESAARDFVTELKRARLAAVSTQQPRRIILMEPEGSEDARRYVLTDEFERRLEALSLPKGIGFYVEDSRSWPVVLSFYPDGTSSGGEVYLANSAGKRLKVRLDPVTGYAKVARRDERDTD